MKLVECTFKRFLLSQVNDEKQKQPLTVPDLLHDELVEADLVDALVQAVGLVDVHHLAVQTLQLSVAQIWTQDLIVELLWRKQPESV